MSDEYPDLNGDGVPDAFEKRKPLGEILGFGEVEEKAKPVCLHFGRAVIVCRHYGGSHDLRQAFGSYTTHPYMHFVICNDTHTGDELRIARIEQALRILLRKIK